MHSIWQDWLVGLLVAGCVLHLARRAWQFATAPSGGAGCATGCASCPVRGPRELVTLEPPRDHARHGRG